MNKTKIVTATFIVLFVLLAVVLLTVSCAPNYDANSTSDEIDGNAGVGVVRYIDYEAGVVCWIFRFGESVSCMPISDTLLSP